MWPPHTWPPSCASLPGKLPQQGLQGAANSSPCWCPDNAPAKPSLWHHVPPQVVTARMALSLTVTGDRGSSRSLSWTELSLLLRLPRHFPSIPHPQSSDSCKTPQVGWVEQLRFFFFHSINMFRFKQWNLTALLVPLFLFWR